MKEKHSTIIGGLVVLFLIAIVVSFFQYDISKRKEINEAYNKGYLEGFIDGKEKGIELSRDVIRNYKKYKK